MQSWQTTQVEYFTGNVQAKWYKTNVFYVTYKRWNVWYEMKFTHNLN